MLSFAHRGEMAGNDERPRSAKTLRKVGRTRWGEPVLPTYSGGRINPYGTQPAWSGPGESEVSVVSSGKLYACKFAFDGDWKANHGNMASFCG